jgi:pSer/pThr/pTyr-binding forkhead associated (FHA) protein
VDDHLISRKHAELNYSKGKLYLTDLGSANGTFINAEKLVKETKEINKGDKIVLGESKYNFKIEGME